MVALPTATMDLFSMLKVALTASSCKRLFQVMTIMRLVDSFRALSAVGGCPGDENGGDNEGEGVEAKEGDDAAEGSRLWRFHYHGEWPVTGRKASDRR